MESAVGFGGHGAGCGCGATSARAGVEGYFGLEAVRGVFSRAGATSRIGDVACVVAREWAWFDAVQGLEGRAGCQDDAAQFFVYRTAQYLAFPADVVSRVARDYNCFAAEGRNLVEEKYARMMRATDPERYAHTWARRLEDPSPVRKAALDDVATALRPMLVAAAEELPESARHARVETSVSGHISAVDYFLSEVAGYSLDTLWHLAECLRVMRRRSENLIVKTYENSALLLRALQGSGDQ